MEKGEKYGWENNTSLGNRRFDHRIGFHNPGNHEKTPSLPGNPGAVKRRPGADHPASARARGAGNGGRYGIWQE
jgi:hypothetical protein